MFMAEEAKGSNEMVIKKPPVGLAVLALLQPVVYAPDVHAQVLNGMLSLSHVLLQLNQSFSHGQQ